MKIACFTTLSPIRSGISGYTEDLLPYLTKHLDIDIFIDDYEPLEELRRQYRIYSYGQFEQRYASGEYDMILYHMGNNPYHFYMYPFLVRYPGITVLHDYVLHHFFSGLVLSRGIEIYLEELKYNYGEVGEILGNLHLRGIRTDLEYFMYPMNRTIIDCSLGIIVHSDFLKREIEDCYPTVNVRKINMGIPAVPVERLDKDRIREKLGIPSDSFVIGTFGFVTPIKKIRLVLEAFHGALREIPNGMVVIVGDMQDKGITDLIRGLGLEERVRVTGYVPDEDFRDYIQVTDLAANLRYPTAGETSASLLDIMAHGAPVIIFNYRQFAEIPDDSCIKIDLGDNEKEDLTRVMIELAKDTSLRENIGRKAAEYVATNCSLQGAANDYYDFIVEVFEKTGRDALHTYATPRSLLCRYRDEQMGGSILCSRPHLASSERNEVISAIIRSIINEFADIGMTCDSGEYRDFVKAAEELELNDQ